MGSATPSTLHEEVFTECGGLLFTIPAPREGGSFSLTRYALQPTAFQTSTGIWASVCASMSRTGGMQASESARCSCRIGLSSP